jgi:hypothetical protein
MKVFAGCGIVIFCQVALDLCGCHFLRIHHSRNRMWFFSKSSYEFILLFVSIFLEFCRCIVLCFWGEGQWAYIVVNIGAVLGCNL